MSNHPHPLFEDIKMAVSSASLSQLLDWTHALIIWRQEHGAALTEHAAFHPLALSSLRLNVAKLEETQLAHFLCHKLRKTLHELTASQNAVEQDLALIGISFVLGTIVDMLDNPETPFELASMVYENQTMFDEWYDQLLAMAGLRPRL